MKDRLTVRHPNGYITINETKQLQDNEQSKKVLNRLAEIEDKIEQRTMIFKENEDENSRKE